jgi:hypothetical protein
MAEKSKEKKSKEDKKKEKAEKKALKKEAKEARKKAKVEAKLEKKNKKGSRDKSEDESNVPKKKKFFTIKKIIIFTVILILLASSGFAVYKLYFSPTDEPVIYESVVFKNINLPDEMLKFSFDQINDLYYSFATYDLRIHLINKEIDRINKVGEKYPDQNKIAEKEKKEWIKAKEKVEKKFIKIEKEIKKLYVLHNVNKKQGMIKIKEKDEELLLLAKEALESLDPYIKIIEANKTDKPQGIINSTIYKIKNIL